MILEISKDNGFIESVNLDANDQMMLVTFNFDDFAKKPRFIVTSYRAVSFEFCEHDISKKDVVKIIAENEKEENLLHCPTFIRRINGHFLYLFCSHAVFENTHHLRG